MVEEAFQSLGPARPPGQAAVKADGQHPRPALAAFPVQAIEGVAQIQEELLAIGEAAVGEAHVIGVQRIGHHQLRTAVVDVPEGQLVGIGVGQILEAALLAAQRHRVHGRPALVEAQGPRARDLRVQLDRLPDVLGLDLARDVLVVDPLQPVGRHLPSGIDHGAGLFGAAGQRRRHAVAGDGNALEHPVKPPEARAGAVVVDRFHVPVALALPGLGADDFRQEGFRGGVAMLDRVLATFLVVHDDLHGDACAARPFRIGRLGPVTSHVPAVAHVSPFSFVREARSCAKPPLSSGPLPDFRQAAT